MKFTIKKDILLENLNNVSHAISTKNVIPVLSGIKFDLTKEDANFIADVVKTHMGPWTVDYNGNEVLERPKT